MVETIGIVLSYTVMVPSSLVDLPIFQFLAKNTKIRVLAEDSLYQNFGRTINRIITADPSFVFITCSNSVGPLLETQLNIRNQIAEWFRSHQHSSLIWVSVNPDVNDIFAEIANIKYYHLPEYHALYWPIFATTAITDQDLERKFLSLNKRAEPVRQLLCHWAQRPDFKDSFWFSYLGESDYQGELYSDDAWQRNNEQLKLWYSAWPELRLLADPPKRFITLDNIEDYHRPDHVLDPTWLPNQELYATSFISVISETSMRSIEPNFSEKTFRSIMLGHPILLLGSQYSIRQLRRWRFDVYDDIIDHSYDLEPDHIHRARKVFQELERLNTLELDRCSQLRADIQQRRLQNQLRYRDLFYQLIIRQNQLLPEILEFFQAYLH